MYSMQVLQSESLSKATGIFVIDRALGISKYASVFRHLFVYKVLTLNEDNILSGWHNMLQITHEECIIGDTVSQRKQQFFYPVWNQWSQEQMNLKVYHLNKWLTASDELI